MFLNAIFVLGGLGLVFGAGLALVEKKFAIKEDPRKETIMKLLPGTNCGACGFTGCSAYAEAIVKGGVEFNLCPLGKKDKLDEKIAEIMEWEDAIKPCHIR